MSLIHLVGYLLYKPVLTHLSFLMITSSCQLSHTVALVAADPQWCHELPFVTVKDSRVVGVETNWQKFVNAMGACDSVGLRHCLIAMVQDRAICVRDLWYRIEPFA